MRKGFALCMVFLMIVSTLLIPIPSEALDYGMDQDLGNVDASFWGENEEDYSGRSVAGAGDVNGDGYDDILISTMHNGESSDYAGQTYLIFGKGSGWSMDTDLSASDASFWGEGASDYSGISVAGAGDVNGDGYDDILIGAPTNDDGGINAGQTYLIFGKNSGWAMDTKLFASDASFRGEAAGDNSGESVAGVGDVNGDGHDDILIGARLNDEGGMGTGQTYLVLGKASGWAMDTDLSASDASFRGESIGDHSGWSVAGAGDVNRDGYDDILIGAQDNDDGGDKAGQSYLILGMETGWVMDTDLSASDASFWGEEANDYSGISVASAGDVNGDRYDDILIGAWEYEDSSDGGGRTYLILGKDSGWSMDTDLSVSDASFWGEDADDWSGLSVAGMGDVNRDGYDDIIIGGVHNDEGGIDTGQTYLIFPDHNSGPISISSVKAYSDDEYSHEITYREFGDKIYLELQGNDADANRKNIAQVWVKGSSNPNKRFRLRLLETGKNTGIFRGEMTITNRTHSEYHWINANDGGWVEILSMKNPIILFNLSIGQEIHLEPRPIKVYSNEDEVYSLNFHTIGTNPEGWTLDTNASWLSWDELNNSIVGTPTNIDVGTYWVKIHIQGYINSDEINFTIIVNNSSPQITIQNILSIKQDQLYHVDYNSTDDGQGNIIWNLTTNASWLSMNSTTGVLKGIPTNENIGHYLVNVSVSDGNDGWDHTEFTLTVENINDPPTLYDGNRTPSYGNTSTNFTFSIMYKDIDGDEPTMISLIVDNNLYTMTSNNSMMLNFKRGVQFSCTLNFTMGVHQYYYSISDGIFTVRYPQYENLTTPFILLIIENDTEKDSDGDGYNDTYESITGSDPYNERSTPFDWDGDGWNNSVETVVSTDPRDNLSVPPDMDGDDIPDSIDPDKDGDGVLNVNDAFPDDRDKWETTEVTEGEDGIVWWIVGVVMVVVGVIAGVVLVTRRRRKDKGEGEIKGDTVDEFVRIEKEGNGGDEEVEEAYG